MRMPQICYNIGETVCWRGGKLGDKNCPGILGTDSGISGYWDLVLHGEMRSTQTLKFSLLDDT